MRQHSVSTNWRLRGRLTGLAMIAAASLSGNDIAAARTGLPTPVNNHQKVEFTAPQAAARAHLEPFFAAVIDENGLSNQDAAVRVALPLPDGRQKLVWVIAFGKRHERLFGVMATNETHTVHFELSQIVDWSLVSADGRMYGNFATRLMLETILPPQSDQITAILTETPTPKEWLQ